DDDIGATLPFRLAVLAVTGQTRVFRDNRVAGLGQAVEQGGLADVGPTHQGNYGNHEALHWLFQKTQRPLPFDDSGPTSGSSLADGQTNQLAAAAIGIHPLTDHQRTGTQAVAIDLHATDEVTIYLA